MQSAAAARALGLAYGACVLAAAPAALAQDGLFVDRNRLDTAPPGAQPAPPPRGPAASAPAQAAPEMTLAGVSIAGESDPAALDAIAARAAPLRGRPLTRETLQALLDAVAAHYAAQDIAFSRAFAPPQDFAEGRVRLVVLKGYVSEIAVEGVSGRDARYLHARAAPLLAERPLRNAALLRAMARLTEAPGLAVEARFEQTPGGDPNALRLRIAASRKRVAAGASVNNQGQRLLGRTQYELTAAANGVVHPGDRLQLYYGFPQQNDLYSYAALSYAAPIGVRGLRMQLYASSLRTRPEGLAIAGDAQTASAQLSYPLRESAEASTTISASLDALDSDNAFLGQLIARERTRVLRAGLSYVRVDGAARTQAYAAASFGMDAWGARAAPAYGGPEFAKLTARLAHERPLAPRAILSARMTAQLGARRLPPSERLQFGGEAFGRGFDAGFASASAGVAASTEAARLFTFPGAPASAAEGRLFAFADGARLAADAVFATPGRTLASAGMGLSVRFLRKFDARLTAAAPLAGAHDANGEARLTFGLSATF